MKTIRALVVDDDPLQLKLTVSYLKKLNFRGSTAVNGKDAIEKISKGHYDICFMDIQMPEMDGIEAARVIRTDLNKDLPIIAITSMEEFDYKKSVDAGMNDYIKKPVMFDQLKAVIEKHCPPSSS